MNLFDPDGTCQRTRSDRLVGCSGGGINWGGDSGFGGCSLDGVDIPCDWGNDLLGSGGVARCPNNACYGIGPTGRPVYFWASTNGPGNYYTYSGPGALYYSADQAGEAAGAFFLPLSQSIQREVGGTVFQDMNGVFSYSQSAVGPPCGPSEDCGITISAGGVGSGDSALWHTYPIEQNVGQFLGDRIIQSPLPDYVATPMGSSFGIFLIGSWLAGIQGQYPPEPEMLAYPK